MVLSDTTTRIRHPKSAILPYCALHLNRLICPYVGEKMARGM